MVIVKRLKVFYPSGKEFVSDYELTSMFKNLVNRKHSLNQEHGMLYSGIEFFTDNFCKINVFDREIDFAKVNAIPECTALADETAYFRELLESKQFKVVFDEFQVETLEEAKCLGSFTEIKFENGISNISEILRSQR